MPDFPPGYVYAGEPLDTPYVRHCLRCRVESEEEKFYYWPRMSRLFDEVLTPLFEGWRDCRLLSDQAR
jgi:hypothetical protein